MFVFLESSKYLFSTIAKQDKKKQSFPKTSNIFLKKVTVFVKRFCLFCAFGRPDALLVGHEGLDEDVVVDFAVVVFESFAELLDFIASHFFTE